MRRVSRNANANTFQFDSCHKFELHFNHNKQQRQRQQQQHRIRIQLTNTCNAIRMDTVADRIEALSSMYNLCDSQFHSNHKQTTSLCSNLVILVFVVYAPLTSSFALCFECFFSLLAFSEYCIARVLNTKSAYAQTH